MKKREKTNLLILVSIALILILIDFSSTVLAFNGGYTQGNCEETIKTYDKAIENNSQYSGLLYKKGLNLGESGNYEEAIKAFDEAIKFDSQNTDAWVKKGLCFLRLGNYEEAIKAYDEATKIDPRNLDAWANKGYSLVKINNYEEAIEAFDKAIEIDPQDSVSWYLKGCSHAKLNNYEEAIKAFDEAIKFNSQDSNAWYNKGTCLAELGNNEEAIEAFDKAIEINPKNSNALYNKGYSLECLGKYNEAIEAYNKAIKINPQNSATLYNKGICLAHLGKYNEAIEALDKAIEIDPLNLEALNLKDSIKSNSNGLIQLFFSDNIFVEEDDLLDYSQTFLKTYEDIIRKSNLTSDDLEQFSFYQDYPYSVNATISNIRGASIEFIPHSIDESKVTRRPYPIENLIPIINNEELNSPSIRGLSITGNSSNISTRQNFYGGNVSSISDMENYSIRDGFVYTNNSSNISLYKLTNAPIILGEGANLNGLTYIDSKNVFRKGALIINGTLVLNNLKLILKSNLKKDWTKVKAEEDAIDIIYKEQIDGIFDYSKLTGIGFREIEILVNDYETKLSTGYYQTHRYDQMNDLDLIYKKADQYKIHYSVIETTMYDIEKNESSYVKALKLISDFNTVFDFIVIIAVVFGWFKRRKIVQELKNIFRYLNNTFRRF